MSREHVTETRVRYGETDHMGVVYHANYLVYFELGRTELIRELGVSYAEFEQRGVRLPVVEVGMRLRSSARYDDPLRIHTRLTAVTGARLRFEYTVRRCDEDRVLVEGYTVLGSADESGRPRRLPADLLQTLRQLAEEADRV